MIEKHGLSSRQPRITSATNTNITYASSLAAGDWDVCGEVSIISRSKRYDRFRPSNSGYLNSDRATKCRHKVSANGLFRLATAGVQFTALRRATKGTPHSCEGHFLNRLALQQLPSLVAGGDLAVEHPKHRTATSVLTERLRYMAPLRAICA